MVGLDIALVGDIMLGRLVNERLADAPPQHPWGDTLPVLLRADVRIGNLECVLSDDGEPWPGKVFHFRSDSRNVASLTTAGFDIVSLANNHVLDFGRDSLREMVSTLDRHGILHAGAGADEEAARRPAVWHGRGNDDTSIGFLAVTDNEPDWEATPDSPGVFHSPILLGDERMIDLLLRRVGELRRQVDTVIVSAHWGGNWGREAPERHREVAHALVDAGADVVFGHSPHIVRGVEAYRRRPIIYGAGDFVDDYAIDPVERNDQSFIFVVETRAGVPHSLRLYPTVIVDFQARLDVDGGRATAERMRRLSVEWATAASWRDDEGCLAISL